MVFEIGHASEINGIHDCWNLWPSEDNRFGLSSAFY